MSANAPSVGDTFAPARRGDIICVEVKSKVQPRMFVLVHPDNRRLEDLDVRDYYLWERMDGSRPLAALKQDYYGKFKALPTEHITELARRLLEGGFLENPVESAHAPARARRKSWDFEMALPATALRLALGSPLRLIAHMPALLVLVAATLGLLSFAAYRLGFSAFQAAFAAPSMTRVLLGIVASFYLFAVVRALVVLGFLARPPCMPAETLYLGFAGPFPYLRVSTRGLLLKNWETRLVCHLMTWLLPLFLSAGCFGLLALLGSSITPGWQFALEVGGAAGLIDQVFRVCPFFESSLVRIQSDIIGVHAAVRSLARLYLKSPRHFMEEHSGVEVRQVLLYFVVTFLWVIIGGGLLLMLTSTMAEGLMQEWGSLLPASSLVQTGLKVLLYAPLAVIFLGLFWKMLQPVAQNVMQHPAWENAALLAAGLTLFAGAFGLTLWALPQLLARAAFSLYIVIALVGWVRNLKGAATWLKLHPLTLLVYAICTGAIFLLGQHWAAAAAALAGLLYEICLFRAAAPSLGWGLKAAGAGIAVAVLVAAPALFLGAPIHPAVAMAFPAGLALGLTLSCVSGRSGLQLALGWLGQLLLFLSFNLACAQSSRFTEALAMAGVVLIDLQGWALLATQRLALRRASRHIAANEPDAREAVVATFSAFASDVWGKGVTRTLISRLPGDFRLLRGVETWLARWLPLPGVEAILKIALAAAPWKERPALGKGLSGEPANFEASGDISLNQRTAILMSQLPFRGMKPLELQPLAEALQPVAYKDGALLARAGAEGHDYLEIVVKGRALMLGRDADGTRETVLAELGPGDAVRSKDLLKSSGYPFSVAAAGDVLTARLYRNHFAHWCRQVPGAFARVTEALGLADMISGLSLFRDFSMSQIRLLMGRLTRKDVAAGTEIIRQGEVGDEFYLLHKGSVEVLVDRRKVAELHAGSYFGEIALVQKCTRTATVRSAQSAVLYSLDQKAFDHFFALGRGAQVLKNISSARVEDARAG